GIGANAVISGFFLANGAIGLGDGATLAGAALTQSGAVTTNGAWVSTSPGFGGAGSPPQLVPLGTAGNFSLLGSSITNTAATRVNLDVGATPGVITGFPSPGTTAGAIHANDAVASTAMSDLTAAYSAAAMRSKTKLISGDLNGLTFTAGVYRAGAAIGTTGTVTLDGGGDPTSVFIFQVRAALSFAAGVRIVLINNAQPGNVFWQVDGAVGIGANAQFTGTILGNGAISIGAGVTLSGAALTMAGAITLYDLVATTSPGYAGSLSATISDANFPPTFLPGVSTTLTTSSRSQWTVTDTRMTAVPWDLTVTATAFTSAAGTVETIPRTFAVGSLTLSPGPVIALSGDASNIHTQSVAPSTVPQRIAWSSGSTGTFAFTPTFTLLIPANAYRSNYSGSIADANLNPYSVTITETIG
ncbi:MAG: DUF3494 domain-containing protein, partial [Microbacteriaceae bacterium]|nr:DUF3494 domain-containing protein [Microbacteriaceae bacterium]